MESLFEKISAYNIFNNIIPGAVFCYFFNLFFSVNLGGDGTAYNLCLFYFWGVRMLQSDFGRFLAECDGC